MAVKVRDIALKLFVDHALAARLWFMVAAFLLLLVAAQPVLILNAVKDTPVREIVLLDGKGNIVLSRAHPLFDKRVVEELSVAFTHTFLTRGPGGLSQPELLPKMLTSEGYKKAQEEIAGQLKELTTNGIHQLVVIEEVRFKLYDGRAFGVIVGHIERTLHYGGGIFEDEKPFVLKLRFSENNTITSNKIYPILVDEFELKWKGEEKQTSAEEAN